MPKPNIAIIVLDTLREDHAQGLDRLVDYGFVKYQNAVAPAPWTLPSHVSMFTGLYPSEHGIHETKEVRGSKLASFSRLRMASLRDYNILQKVKEEGYTTYLISANSAIIHPALGFEADINIVIDPIRNIAYTDDVSEIDKEFEKLGSHLKFVIHNIRNSKKLWNGARLFVSRRLNLVPKYLSEYFVREKGGKLALNFVEKINFVQPFFLFINLMESHDPFTSLRISEKLRCVGLKWALTGELNPHDVKLWSKYHIHAGRAITRAIQIVETLGQRNMLDDMLVIVTADHGELIGDGGVWHMYSLKDGNIKVPLYVKYPNTWKKKPQKHQYISLTEIPKIIDKDANALGSQLIIAETFGIHDPDYFFDRCGLPRPSDDSFHHKIRIIGHDADLVFNKTLEKVEYAQGEKIQDIIAHLKLHK